jgi:small-conductance mechanosensitive channel
VGRLQAARAELGAVGLSDHAVTAIVTAGTGIALIVGVRAALRFLFGRYVRRVETRRTADDVASLRTRLTVLTRVIVAFLAVIVVWNFLLIFPSTAKIGNALLASSAVLALIAGLAFTVPLGNLGAGILLAFTQPVRLGDRVTIGETTGRAEQITLIHTVLVTDDERRVFIPNSQMVSSVVVNRSVVDPRRTVTVEVPVGIQAPLDRAKATVLEAARGAPAPGDLELTVRVGTVAEKTAWLTLIAYAPPTTDVAALAGELRERALTALAREQLLPA